VSSFTAQVSAKGYTLKELGELWGLKERQMYNIAASPKQMHLHAIAGLPRKKDCAL